MPSNTEVAHSSDDDTPKILFEISERVIAAVGLAYSDQVPEKELGYHVPVARQTSC